MHLLYVTFPLWTALPGIGPHSDWQQFLLKDPLDVNPKSPQNLALRVKLGDKC